MNSKTACFRIVRRRRPLAAFLFFLACLGEVLTASAQVTFQAFGDTGPPGALYYARDVSDDGSIVIGGWQSDDSSSGTFRWTEETGAIPLTVDPQYADSAMAASISGDGRVIVGWGRRAGTLVGLRWSGAEPQPEVFDLGLQGIFMEVSYDGSAIFGSGETPEGWMTFIWNGYAETLASEAFPFEVFTSSPVGVSADGRVLAGHLEFEEFGNVWERAFRWTAGGRIQNLGTLVGDRNSDAAAISADGNVIVGRSGFRAFRWTEKDGMVALNMPSTVTSSNAKGTTYDGSTIVGTYGGGPWGRSGVFVWDEDNGMRDLEYLLESAGVDITGWRLHSIAAITPDGNTIIGSGTYESMRASRSWIIRDFNSLIGQPAAVPESSTYAIGAASVVLVLILARRHRRRFGRRP